MKRRKTYAPPQSRVVMLTLEGLICAGSDVIQFPLTPITPDTTYVDGSPEAD